MKLLFKVVSETLCYAALVVSVGGVVGLAIGLFTIDYNTAGFFLSMLK